jgi:hypothetical protein
MSLQIRSADVKTVNFGVQICGRVGGLTVCQWIINPDFLELRALVSYR